MGSKRVTKASVILAAAKQRLDLARQVLFQAQADYELKVATAHAVVMNAQDNYDDLEKALAVKPRGGNGGPKLSSTTASGAGRRSSRARSVASLPPPTGDEEVPATTVSGDVKYEREHPL